MVFPESRIDLIATRMVEKGYDVNTVCEEVVEVQYQIEDFEREFQRKHGIHLQFSNEAIDRVVEIGLDEDGKGIAICNRLLKDYEHGMKLIRDKIGRREFIITKEAIDSPEEYLNRIIREIYKRQSDQGVEGKE